MTLRLLLTVLVAAGLGLFAYSLALPYYTNEKAAEELLNSNFLTRSGSAEDFKAEYYRKEAALRTPKLAYMDAGVGMALAAATVLLFFGIAGVRTVADGKHLTTLTKPNLFVAANLVWLLTVPGTYWYYSFRAGRGDYPPFADSIAIPIFTQIPVYLLALLPLNLFLLLTTIRAQLPTRIFLTAAHYGKAALAWEVLFGTLLLLNAVFLVELVLDGNHVFIIVNLFFTYVLLTLRAGQINKWAAPPAQQLDGPLLTT